MAIGEKALSLHNYVLSIQYFNQIIKTKPYLAEPYMHRANAKILLGDIQGADEDCTKSIEINPFLPRAYFLRGYVKYETKAFNEAVKDITKALEFAPNDSSYLLFRIDCYAKNNQIEKVIDDIDLYLKQYPKSDNILYYKASCYLELKDTLRAENEFQKIIDLFPNSSYGWSGKGMIYISKGDNEKALYYYNNAIKQKSTYAGDYINRGIINKEKKNYIQALSDYDNAIKYDSTEYLAYYNRGTLRAFLGDNNRAIQDLKKASIIDPTKAEPYLQKAILEEQLGYYKTAIDDLKKIIELHPYFVPAYEELSNLEKKQGNEKLAYYYLQKASDIDINKEYYKQKANEKKNTSTNPKAPANTEVTLEDKRQLFQKIALENSTDSVNVYQVNKAYKGQVQDNFANLTNEPDFALSFIPFKYELRRTNLYLRQIDEFNKFKIVPITLSVANLELPSTDELKNLYLSAIDRTTDSISKYNNNPNLYFCRALEYCAVKNYTEALTDLNKVLDLDSNHVLAIFAKADIQTKLLDSNKTEKSQLNATENNILNNNLNESRISLYSFTYDTILKEYNKVITLNPDFTFAYYNKANILCTQKDFRTAILNYSKAIEIDPDFAEAYFNRGLTYLFIGEDAKGLSDLSKSGELGIYKVYNLIQRFKQSN